VTHTYSFSVDARLLRELGERLVGRPHIALAELIKNAYDADATLVELDFSPAQIVVTDNGHGMSTQEFESRWMRIGSTHKAANGRTAAFHREVTGSKGIGRLAAQVLASQLLITSVGVTNKRLMTGLTDEISAPVNWADAVSSGTLTEVRVVVDEKSPTTAFAGGSPHGTRIVLSRLASEWDADDFRRLAQEVWSLQPPFDSNADFKITLNTEYEDVFAEFSEQMAAILEIWNGRITGKLRDRGFIPPSGSIVTDLPHLLPRESQDERAGRAIPAPQLAETRASSRDRILEATIRLRDRESRKVYWRIRDCDIHRLRFDVRIFELQRRQPRGIRVDVARSYLRRFGGVGIYDGGFRLPYYGADIDWLNIESDNAARLTASSLLPEELNVKRGLLSLPRNANIFGETFVSTSFESQESGRESANDRALSIQVTRDRLVDNRAYQQLRVMLRAPIDAYAMEKTRQASEDSARRVAIKAAKKASATLDNLKRALDESRESIPAGVYSALVANVNSAIAETLDSETRGQEFSSLLGALATAGITSLAYEHEVSKQLGRIDAIARQLTRIEAQSPGLGLEDVVDELRAWSRRARNIRKMFAPLVSEDDRNTVSRFEVKQIVDEVSAQVEVLAHGVRIDTSKVPAGLRLPDANLPAWSAVFQNLLVNSFNALSRQASPVVQIDGGVTGNTSWVRVQDNGSGVDLSAAESYWTAFKRGPNASSSPDGILGGTGLGLTIVRMIGNEIGVESSFSPPTPGFSTAVTISWKD
jgi:signal transduction histidine kinase